MIEIKKTKSRNFYLKKEKRFLNFNDIKELIKLQKEFVILDINNVNITKEIVNKILLK